MFHQSRSLTFLLRCSGAAGGAFLTAALPCAGHHPQTAEHVPPAALCEDTLCPAGSRGLHPGQQQLLLHHSIPVSSLPSLAPVPRRAGSPWQRAHACHGVQGLPKGHQRCLAGRDGRVVQAKGHLCCRCHCGLMWDITLGLPLLKMGESE